MGIGNLLENASGTSVVKKYELLNGDKVIATFSIVGSGALESVTDTHILGELPFWLTDISEWLHNRSAAKHRSFVKDLLSKLSADTRSGFIDLTNCLSLQDTLWVRLEISNLTWDAVNLYNHDFSEVMTHLAFDGTGLYGMQIRTTSPELTTDGAYDKCWVRRDGDTVLLKAGSTGARNTGLEPYCEALASQFYNEFCKSVVYGIETYRGKVVSSCKSFVRDTFGYKPISLWLANTELNTVLSTIEKNGCDVNEFRRMIVADSVMVNSDRHFGNFGFLVDNRDYHVIGLAPAFDYNMALSPYAEFGVDFPIYDEYLRMRGPMFGGTYEDLAKILLTSDMKADLINLKDLELVLPDWCYEEHKYQFTHERTAILNEVKNVMIDRILGNKRQFSFVKEEVK